LDSTALYFPLGQTMQPAALATALYLPAGHTTHDRRPAAAAYLAAWQSLQLVAPLADGAIAARLVGLRVLAQGARAVRDAEAVVGAAARPEQLRRRAVLRSARRAA